MTHNEKNEDVNRILQYLTNDKDFDTVDVRNHKMDIYQEGLLSDSWPTYTEDLLENIFSLEEGSINLLDETMPDFTLTDNTDNVSQPSQATSSACSDSGLSSDQAEFDFEQQLSPFLIQNSCDEAAAAAPGTPCAPPPEPTYDADEFERSVMPGFINRDTFQPGKTGRKRRLSQTPQAVVQPKQQKPTIRVSAAPATAQKPQLIVKAQQRPVKVANIQVINPQPKVYCKPDNMTHRKVIRVAPMAGNPRSILLPVTIKDMKDLKSIKIINAADLKNASNIKLAAANLLSQSKLQDLKMESNGAYEYETLSNNCEDSGSDDSDDDLPKERHDGKNGYPRLVLTAEERRLLTKEGISLPPSYPLTKHEERELKRIRRKIRNKISAQDSRKRKKEYVDGLEDRVKQCTSDNQTLVRRIKILQSQNHSLTTQLKRLQHVLTSGAALPAPASAPAPRAAPPATCLLVLLLSVALVALPSLQRERERDMRQPQQHHEPAALKRALLSAPTYTSLEEAVIDEGEFNMEELISFSRPHSDHDYPLQGAKRQGSARTALPGGYVDLPVDEEWPPDIKKSIRTLQFDYEDGKDYLPPLIKEEKYENAYSVDSRSSGIDFLSSNLLTIGGKLGEFLEYMPPIPVKNEDLVIEEVDDYDARNGTEVKSFVVNGTVSNI